VRREWVMIEGAEAGISSRGSERQSR